MVRLNKRHYGKHICISKVGDKFKNKNIYKVLKDGFAKVGNLKFMEFFSSTFL